MQAAHALGGLDVDGVLRLDLLRLVACNEAEQANVLVQVFEGEFDGFAIFAALVVSAQAVYPKAGEVADDDDLRQVALGQAGKIVERLLKCAVEVFAARFVFYQQHAGPEQIDKALRGAELFDVELERGHALVGDAEDFKKVDPEGLGLRVFVGGVCPGAAEGERARFDLVPAEGHGWHGLGGGVRRLRCSLERDGHHYDLLRKT